MSQLGLLISRHQQLPPNSVTLKWLKKITPALGYTATTMTRTAPDEITFNRSAPAGLTAFELLVLGNWLEARNFPGFDLSLPPDSANNTQSVAPAPRMPAMPTPAH
jgi:hypothetical protein